VDRTKKNEVAQELVPAELNHLSSEKTKGPAALEKVDPEKETNEALQRTRATRNLRDHQEEANRKFTPINSVGERMGNKDEEMENKVKRNADGSICEDCN